MKGGLRIIGGSLRGRRLSAPPGSAVRPTSDRVREALFDILGPSVQGARFLDLFAGSGAAGIEALSRGAASVVLVESAAVALRTLAVNLEALGVARAVRIVPRPWPHALPIAVDAGGPFSIVFADPPYGDEPERASETGHPRADDAGKRAGASRHESAAAPSRAPYSRILESLSEPGVLDPDGLVVLEHEARGGAPSCGGRLTLTRVAPYGRAALAFYRLDRPGLAVLASPVSGI